MLENTNKYCHFSNKAVNFGAANTETNKKMASIKNMEAPGATTKNTLASTKNSDAEKNDNVRYKNRAKRFKTFTIPNVESGHYLIANVYKGTKYMTKFIEELESQGIEADYFQNPRNGLNYVYLKGFSNKQDAIAAYKSKLNGTYNGDTWVMKISGSYDGTQYASTPDNNSKYDANTLQKNVVTNTQEGSVPSGVTYKTLGIDGVGSGFYIIANVFEIPSNANRFVKELNAKGLNAGYFINPENNYRYVYLKRHSEWTNALVAYYSKLNNTYDDKIWIMRVKPNQIS